MPLSEKWRELVSGKPRSTAAKTARAALTLLSTPYAAAVRLRNGLYNRNLLRAHRLDRPVICIGNLTVGGTGKTPLVAWLTQHLADRGLQPAVLTRGYKATAGQSDEVRCLRQALPSIDVVVDSDRVRAGRHAIDNLNAQVLILDDGFQHRRLARQLDIVVIDATCPFGYGRLLPAGLLREPATALARAHAAVISRSDLVPPDQVTALTDKVASLLNPTAQTNKPVAHAQHKPTHLLTPDGQHLTLDQLHNTPVAAFCGIGNPQAFFATLEKLGAKLVTKKVFTDHHPYTEADITQLASWARQSRAALVITTEKDYVKLQPLQSTPTLDHLARLQVAMNLTLNAHQLTACLQAVLRQYNPE